MPYSYGEYKNNIRDHIVDNFPRETKILDVGPGSGSYGRLLKPHYDRVDGIEIFPNYVEMFNLREVYDKIIIGDIREFDFSNYDYIIMGDVVEHLTIQEATNLLQKIYRTGKRMLMAVPYQYEQGEEYGNIYETHHQPDLTVALVYQRYPMMRLLYGDFRYGYYINYIPPIK